MVMGSYYYIRIKSLCHFLFYAAHKVKEIRMTRVSFDNAISRIVEPFPRKNKRNFYVEMRSKRDELVPRYENIMSQRFENYEDYC